MYLSRRCLFSFLDSVRNRCYVKANRPNRIVVTRNDVVDSVRVTVGVDNAENRNPQLVRFAYRNVFVLHINHEQGIWQTAHVLDPTEAAFELIHQPGFLQSFFFGQHLERAIRCLNLELFEPFDRLTNGFVVGQHATEPTLINERHTHAFGLLPDHFCCRTFGTDEKDFAPPGAKIT